MKLYSYSIPNSSYEITFDSEEYEADPDRFRDEGPFVYWEDHKQALARIAEYDDDNLALSQSVVKLGARIEELRQAFTRYGRHTGPCLDSGHRACICGYAETFKSLMVRSS